MGKVLDYLKKDRGGTNFNKIFSKIPESFYETAGFVIVLLMMGSLVLEELLNVFFRKELYIRLFYVLGTIGILFSILYIISRLIRQQKKIEQSEYENKKKVKKSVDQKTGKVKVIHEKTNTEVPKMKDLFRGHIWDFALAAMLLWSCISAFLSENRSYALTGAPFRHDGLDAYFIYAGMYVCAKAVKSEKKQIWMMRGMMIAISLLSLLTVLQVNDSWVQNWGKIGDNITGFEVYAAAIYLNTNHFAYVLTIGLMAMAGLVIIEKKLAAKIAALLLFALNLWALIINDTFGSYIGVLFGIVFLAVITLVKDQKRYKEVIGIIAVFLIVSMIMNSGDKLLSKNFDMAYQDSKTMDTNDFGGSGRIGLWKETLKCIKEKPVFGFGPEGLYDRLYEAGLQNDRPHNEYLQHAAFLGIPGLLFYLTALITLLVYCLKNLKKIPMVFITLGGIVFGYCVSAFFGNTLYYTTPYYFMFLGLLASCNEGKQKENSHE